MVNFKPLGLCLFHRKNNLSRDKAMLINQMIVRAATGSGEPKVIRQILPVFDKERQRFSVAVKRIERVAHCHVDPCEKVLFSEKVTGDVDTYLFHVQRQRRLKYLRSLFNLASIFQDVEIVPPLLANIRCPCLISGSKAPKAAVLPVNHLAREQVRLTLAFLGE